MNPPDPKIGVNDFPICLVRSRRTLRTTSETRYVKRAGLQTLQQNHEPTVYKTAGHRRLKIYATGGPENRCGIPMIRIESLAEIQPTK